jgi:hypothetical protein
VDVLNDQWQESLSAIALSWFTDRAGGRIGPEALVVGSSVVVAGESEAGWKWKDEESRGEWKKSGKPRRSSAVDPGVGGVRKKER